MKNLILGAILAFLFVVISYLFGHDPSFLECFLFGVIASLLADVLLDD
jgi:hypothetical protein